jgi:hypothetical protein
MPLVRDQGVRFEKTAEALLSRLLRHELGYDLLEVRRQGSGLQWGYDLRVRWRTPNGQQASWHVECKSHHSTLPTDEVIRKLDQILASHHPIDVWCLACAHVEPTNDLDESLARKRESDEVPFAIEVLSPQTNFIKELFECFPDLYRRLYREEGPPLDGRERRRRIERFRQFLDAATRRGRAKLLPPGWLPLDGAVVTASADDEEEARAFLRGLHPEGSWSAIAHGWAIERASATDSIVARIDAASAGLDALWLAGGGGEGKSTVCRQIAWHYLTARDDAEVLWIDRLLAPERPTIPGRWIGERTDGAFVLVVVDDVANVDFAGVERLEARLKERGVRVFLLLNSRSAERVRHSDVRRRVARMAKGEAEMLLPPLSDDELQALVNKLDEAGLLQQFSRRQALDRLHASNKQDPEQTWLLPTLMQLTDRRGRGFEEILLDVLLALNDSEMVPAGRLLVAIAICHASHAALPTALAIALLEPRMDLAQAQDILAGELSTQFEIPVRLARIPTGTEMRYGRRLFLHHDVIAEGFAEVAADRRPADYMEALELIARSVQPAVDPELVIPRPLFRILDRVLERSLGRQEYQAAEALLLEWAQLDDRQFPAWHRLGVCYSDHIQEAAKRGPSKRELGRLYDAGNTALHESLVVARRVLGREETPAPFRHFELVAHEGLTYTALATLAGRAGAALGERRLLRLSVVLAVLSLTDDISSSRDRFRNAVATGTLAESFLYLHDYEAAAATYAAAAILGEVAPSRRHVRRTLDKLSIPIPDHGIERFAEAIQERLQNMLDVPYDEVGVYDSPDHYAAAVRRGAEAPRHWIRTKPRSKRANSDAEVR